MAADKRMLSTVIRLSGFIRCRDGRGQKQRIKVDGLPWLSVYSFLSAAAIMIVLHYNMERDNFGWLKSEPYVAPVTGR